MGQYKRINDVMSLDESGINCSVQSSQITIAVLPNYPLIKLANALDWESLKDIALPDLKASTFKGKWWLGRKLKLRVHLAISFCNSFIIKQIGKWNML